MSIKVYIELDDAAMNVTRIVVEAKDSLGASGAYQHTTPDGLPQPPPPEIVACLPWIRTRVDSVRDVKLRAALKASGVADENLDAAVTAAKAARRGN